ncbi:MAG: DUF885 family protein [Armatimonadia bacterium]|nr:DUF885 family protein [Armatimonadia bacterium]
MSELRSMIERYSQDKEALERFYDVPHSRVSIDRRRSFAESWGEALSELGFEGLGVDGRVDYHLLQNHLDGELANREVEESRLTEVTEVLPFLPDLVRLEEDRRAMARLGSEETGRRLGEIAVRVAQTAEALDPEESSASPSLPRLERARQALEAVLPLLKSWRTHYAGYRPEFDWWLRAPYRKVRKGLKSCLKAVKARLDDDQLVGDPIGRPALERAIGHQYIPYGPEDLIAMGERQMAWCTERMLEVSRELGCGDDWKAALEKVKDRHEPLGRQHELVEDLAREAIEYVDEHVLVTVDALCRETWTIDMIDQEGQKRLPFLGYGGQKILVSYPTRGMDLEAAQMAVRANNEHFTRAVTHHELIPGHHLQIYMAQRHRAYRQVFRTPFLSEGWCLHWELLLWDRGFARGPEDRVGMLFWLMHRCARIGVSLRFHLGEMSPDEMVDHLVEQVGHERDAARSEVRRYIGDAYGPLYQCAYMIGALQMRALYRELVTEGELGDRDFHDAVLRQGPIPIELLRAGLRRELLAPDHRASWEFGG